MSTVNQHIYLISDSTGETVSTIARSIYARFEKYKFLENKWALIRTEKPNRQYIKNYSRKTRNGFIYHD